MADLKIRVFKSGEAKPYTNAAIPGIVLKIASKLVSKRLIKILRVA